jgi:methionyl-tRNA formyltransferase
MWQGETVTGVSVIHMTPKLDGGPVVVQRSLEIDPRETAGELESRLADDGVAATLESLAELAQWDGHSGWGEIQDPAQASRAPRLQKSDGQIDWSQTAAQIDCHVRAMQPWPTAFTTLKCDGRADIRITIRSLEPTAMPRPDQLASGQIVVEGQELFVAAADRLVQIHNLQPAGKKAMAAADFLRGHPHAADAMFGT